ncbi:transaldolase family protein [Garciella nitratireducens]|nr:transaldolase family protein [Garciella nitratireducens]
MHNSIKERKLLMFLDTGNILEIARNIKLGIFEGVTTNPTLLLKEKEERFQQINKILEQDINLIFVQIVGDGKEQLKKDYEKIQKINTEKKIGIKVPINRDGLELIYDIKEQDPEQSILGTAIYSADQGILASLAGCDYIAPYVNRMSNNSLDPYRIISQIRTFIDDRGLTTKIMGASFKNSNQVIDTLMAGAHTVTIPPDIVEQMVHKELALSAIQVFHDHEKQLDQWIKR